MPPSVLLNADVIIPSHSHHATLPADSLALASSSLLVFPGKFTTQCHKIDDFAGLGPVSSH
jgi:hypothetical protein